MEGVEPNEGDEVIKTNNSAEFPLSERETQHRKRIERKKKTGGLNTMYSKLESTGLEEEREIKQSGN